MTFDHGVLNIPLAKRGNIDTQLDAHKAKQATLASVARKERAASQRAAKASAKRALAALLADADLMSVKASRIGCTPRALSDALTDWSKWEPTKVIKALAEWLPNHPLNLESAK